MDDLLVTCSILTMFEVASGIDAFVDINSRYKMRALAGAAYLTIQARGNTLFENRYKIFKPVKKMTKP